MYKIIVVRFVARCVSQTSRRPNIFILKKSIFLMLLRQGLGNSNFLFFKINKLKTTLWE